ncbi:MAG: dTDP-4-dehydrorhamnose reductase [Filimonas sp.]|nr:dTDP-4-dehydrorhamnose reductase [Filimonas sp.]
MNNTPVIIVSGSKGQLGYELQQQVAANSQFEYVFTDREELDITNAAQVRAEFEKHKPAFFINCAAYTAVDKAETDKDLALAINATAVGIIAECCKAYGTKLIHISTDYVFNGNGTAPYEPDETTDPVNYYGYSKLIGEEKAIAHNGPNTVIIRTSWVYSTHGHNFVKTMLRLMKERESISVVNDQVGSPTYARDLAIAIMKVVRQIQQTGKVENGFYHFSNSGVISWFDFAVAIKEIADLNCAVNGIPTSGYPTPAKRPAYSVMNTEKIKEVYGVKLPEWRESLKECMAALLNG